MVQVYPLLGGLFVRLLHLRFLVLLWRTLFRFHVWPEILLDLQDTVLDLHFSRFDRQSNQHSRLQRYVDSFDGYSQSDRCLFDEQYDPKRIGPLLAQVQKRRARRPQVIRPEVRNV